MVLTPLVPGANKNAYSPDTLDNRRRIVRAETPAEPSIRTILRSPSPNRCQVINPTTSDTVTRPAACQQPEERLQIIRGGPQRIRPRPRRNKPQIIIQQRMTQHETDPTARTHTTNQTRLKPHRIPFPHDSPMPTQHHTDHPYIMRSRLGTPYRHSSISVTERGASHSVGIASPYASTLASFGNGQAPLRRRHTSSMSGAETRRPVTR